MIPIISAAVGLGQTLIEGVAGYFRRKQEIRAAVARSRVRMAESEQSHNQDWELKSLENAGWKDDVLFYAIVAMYAYSAVDPEGAARVFRNWESIPEWFREITFWLVASVLGVKKIGDYLPGVVSGLKRAFKD